MGACRFESFFQTYPDELLARVQVVVHRLPQGLQPRILTGFARDEALQLGQLLAKLAAHPCHSTEIPVVAHQHEPGGMLSDLLDVAFDLDQICFHGVRVLNPPKGGVHPERVGERRDARQQDQADGHEQADHRKIGAQALRSFPPDAGEQQPGCAQHEGERGVQRHRRAAAPQGAGLAEQVPDECLQRRDPDAGGEQVHPGDRPAERQQHEPRAQRREAQGGGPGHTPRVCGEGGADGFLEEELVDSEVPAEQILADRGQAEQEQQAPQPRAQLHPGSAPGGQRPAAEQEPERGVGFHCHQPGQDALERGQVEGPAGEHDQTDQPDHRAEDVWDGQGSRPTVGGARPGVGGFRVGLRRAGWVKGVTRYPWSPRRVLTQ